MASRATPPKRQTRARPAAKRTATARRRAPARRRRARRSFQFTLDQRELDVLGLGLVALGVFMGCVLYGQWNGGSAGNGAAHWLAVLFGDVRDGVPIALAGAGAMLVLRPVIGSPRPLRASPFFLGISGTLGLAANTLGVAGTTRSHSYWAVSYFEHRGGILGQAELWVTTHVVGTLGADFIAIFLFLGGVVLLSGGSLALAIRSFGAGVAGAKHHLPAMPEIRRAPRQPRRRPARIVPPEPTGRELVLRAGHVEAPPNDFPDFMGFDDEEEPCCMTRITPRRSPKGRSPSKKMSSSSSMPRTSLRRAGSVRRSPRTRAFSGSCRSGRC